MRTLTSDASAALRRALRAHLDRYGPYEIEEMRSRSWASVTFAGARHEIKVVMTGNEAAEAADALTAKLDVEEYSLRGHILADLVCVGREIVAGQGVRLSLEALTVEDA